MTGAGGLKERRGSCRTGESHHPTCLTRQIFRRAVAFITQLVAEGACDPSEAGSGASRADPGSGQAGEQVAGSVAEDPQVLGELLAVRVRKWVDEVALDVGDMHL